MPRYKWESAQDWLGQRINARKETVEDFILRGKGTADDADHALADIVNIANGVVNGEFVVDNDRIQDVFQDDMDREGFFWDLDLITRLTREQCVALLETISIECHDEETVETLRQAVEANVLDGSLVWDEIKYILAPPIPRLRPKGEKTNDE